MYSFMQLVLLILVFHYQYELNSADSRENTTDLPPPILDIPQGTLMGIINTDWRGNKYYSFRGIPYATPPLNELRFKAPVPIDPIVPWQGIRNATIEGSNCFQVDPRHVATGSENCLFINVNTPSISKDAPLKPVMFYVFGGNFNRGSGDHLPLLGCDYLLTEDVLFVTFNYRLGVLGFLALENNTLGVPGNAGLKDMVLALKWTRQNIKYFRGDPDNITIFGHSAGSGAVSYLLLSQMTTGLFHKAIFMSGVAINQWAIGRKNAVAVANKLGNNATTEKQALDYLMSLPTATFRNVDILFPDYLRVNESRVFAPVVEYPNPQEFISDTPMNILLKAKYQKVPIMIGYVDREGMYQECTPHQFGLEISYHITNFENVISTNYHLPKGSVMSRTIARKIREYYYDPPGNDRDKYYDVQGDVYYFRGIYNKARIIRSTSNIPVFMYRFTLDTKLNTNKRVTCHMTAPGASHADDIYYIFNCPYSPKPEPGSVEETAMLRVLNLWTNFARTSNPTPPNDNRSIINTEWPPLNSTDIMRVFQIGLNLTVIDMPLAERLRMQFWDKIDEMYADWVIAEEHSSGTKLELNVICTVIYLVYYCIY